MNKNVINLALFKEESLCNKLLKSYLSTKENINIIFYGSDPVALQRKMSQKEVDVLLTDLFVNNQDIIGLLENVKISSPATRILILSKARDMVLISNLLALGINGYIPESGEPDEIYDAIIEAGSGRIYRNHIFTEALYRNMQEHTRSKDAYDTISLDEREKKILQLVWQEKSNREIADEIFISIRSVEKIRQDLRKKTGIKSTIGLIKYAIGKRIIILETTMEKMFAP